MATFAPDSWVWILDETERFLPAKVVTAFKKGEASSVALESGEKRALSKDDMAFVCECNPEALDLNTDDMINISDLNEMSILHQLRVRFKVDKIYTNISSILISVNPFKMVPIFTPEYIEKYRTGDRSLPPHAYAISNSAYNNMRNEDLDQCVVCSGESGSGKSEATKVVLQFLTDAAMRNTPASADGKTSNLAQMILSANPILEAFGNAKTLRNNNSSRFGKLITMKFDRNGGIVGGSIINYLLEKSRVVRQTLNERNYHIFYQVVAAAQADPKLADELGVKSAELFDYLNQSGVINIPGVNDEKEFEDMVHSMVNLNFSDDERMGIFKVVSGALHFGNLKYKENVEAIEIVNADTIPHAASMWGVNLGEIKKFLVSRNVGSKEIINTPLTMVQALDTRDALTKKVYGDTFQWTVDKINIELSNGNAAFNRFIGVLDIFGFESFDINSFEQLCINFCNEKLQFHFNTHIFKMEQALYQTEGIVLPDSSFQDNQPTLDLIELKGTGIIPMLDDELNVPKGSDDGFLSKIIKTHEKKHPNFLKPGPKDCKENARSFGVLHYAGPVYYFVADWLEKNKDQISVDILNVLRASESPFIKAVFPADDGAAKKGSKLTLGTQFKNQLNQLIDTLNSAYPHFVRCMKSNDKKSGGIFEAKRMQDQLRYAGLVEVCRIRKLGYPIRRTYADFYKRYKHIEVTCMDLDALLKVLVDRKLLIEGEWAKGTTRVFYRQPGAIALEIAREKAFLTIAVKLQKKTRGTIFVRRFMKFKEIVANIKKALVSRLEPVLAAAVEQSKDLPFGGSHLALVTESKQVYARVVEENKVIKLLDEATGKKDLSALKATIQLAGAMQPPFAHQTVTDASTLVAKIEVEVAAKAELATAVASRDLKKLQSALSKAASLGIDSSEEMQQAVTLQARIVDENDVIAKISAATASKDVAALNTLMSKATELGILARPEIASVKTIVEKLIKEQKSSLPAADAQKVQSTQDAANKSLEEDKKKREQIETNASAQVGDAVKTRDSFQVNKALTAAISVNLTGEVVKEAQEFVKEEIVKDAHTQELEALIRVIKTKSQTIITEADLVPLKTAIEAARVANLPGTEKIIKQAEMAHTVFTKYAAALFDLKIAMAIRDRNQLRQALGVVQNYELETPMVEEAMKTLKEIDVMMKAQQNMAAEAAASVAGFDAEESTRKAREETAREARFDLKNYEFLRLPEDYSKGMFNNKVKLRENFLSFQSTPIPRSITELEEKHSKLAVQVHKSLLAYMGDKPMPYPAILAQDILQKGYDNPPLRDEIFALIIKQLTANPRPESVAKGWQVLCMCVHTFPPSIEFENFLLHFILERRDRGRGAVVDYANFCLHSLEAMLANGDGTGFVPSALEILAYKQRPPVLASIYLVDGNTITENLPITPDLQVGNIIDMCTGWLDLKDPRTSTFGLFVYDLGEYDDPTIIIESSIKNAPFRPLIRTPRPLRNDEYLGDVVVQRARQKRKFKIVLKKKIFLPVHNGRGKDAFFERLIYLQAEDEAIIQGNIEFEDEEKVVTLAAASMAIAYGDAMGASLEELVDARIDDFIVPSWRSKKSREEWAKLVLPLRDTLVSADPEDLQDNIATVISTNAFYGMHWFYVYKANLSATAAVPPSIKSLPKDLLLGFNPEGLYIFTWQRQLLACFPYADIYRWGGSPSQFSMIMADSSNVESFEFTVVTGQAPDMAAIILDHIRAIMTAHEDADPEKI